MHTVTYNGVNFSTLGPELEVVGQSSVLEPADAPQYRRTTIRFRYNFFEPNWIDNYGLVKQIRDAFKFQQGVLTWLDDDGNTVLNRRVMMGAHDLPEANSQGSYRQQVNWTMTYLELPASDGIVPNTIAATYQRAGGTLLTFSTVERWTEALDTKLYSEWRSDRARVSGTVSASGKILGNSTLTLGQSQTTLFAVKDQMMAEFAAKDEGTFKFGSFNQVIRGIKFDAVIDQAQDLIRWSLHGQFTRAPEEGNYAQIDLNAETRDNYAMGAQGQTELILSGKIESDSAPHAYSALAAMELGLVPSDYTLIEDGNVERLVDGFDGGPTFIDLSVRQTYRQNKTGLVTWLADSSEKNPRLGPPLLTLGILEHFSDAYTGELFSEFRNQRHRAGGIVEMSGRYQLGPNDDAETLYDTMAQWLAQMSAHSSGTLSYGSVFEQDVRLVSFTPQVNEGIRAITWSLTAHFTRFPNEAGYAICDFRAKTANVNTEGAVELTLTGKIESQSQASALAALAGIRQTTVPTGYVALEKESDARTVIADNDGTTFIELTFAEKYRLTSGQIVTWTLKQTDSADTRTGMIRSVFSGTVLAYGASLASAYTAAQAQAVTLGAGKYPMLMRSDITQIDKLFLTPVAPLPDALFVEVEFLYEYLRKGTLIYLEAHSEITKDAFGQDIQTVSGYCAGPSNSVCQTAYLANIKNAQAQGGLMVLSEKTGFSTAQITNVTGAQLDVRFDFVLTLHLRKAPGEMAASYSIMMELDYLELETKTTVEGVAFALSPGFAQAVVNAIVNAGNYGLPVKSTSRQRFQQGQNTQGANLAADFFQYEFGVSFVGPLTGTATIIESQITVDVTYAGNRWIEQPIPGTTSIMQNTGTRAGTRKVSGHVKAASSLAAQQWAQAQHGFIAGDPAGGTFELPPQISTTFEFLPLRVGIAPAPGVAGETNVRVYVVSFNFVEMLPSLTLPYGK